MFSLFTWLRTRTCESFLAGISDGLAQIDDATADGVPDALAALRQRLVPQLPAPQQPEEPAPAKGRRKEVTS